MAKTNLPALKSQLSKLANFLESEGLVREAYNLDIYLNTLDSQKIPNIDLIRGVCSSVLSLIKNLDDNIAKVYEFDKDGYKKVTGKFNKIYKTLKPLLKSMCS